MPRVWSGCVEEAPARNTIQKRTPQGVVAQGERGGGARSPAEDRLLIALRAALVGSERRQRRAPSPANMFVDPERWLRAQLPLTIAAEAISLVAGAFAWPISLLETDVGNIPHFYLVMGLFLVGLVALFIGLDLLVVLQARREMRRQRATMR